MRATKFDFEGSIHTLGVWSKVAHWHMEQTPAPPLGVWSHGKQTSAPDLRVWSHAFGFWYELRWHRRETPAAVHGVRSHMKQTPAPPWSFSRLVWIKVAQEGNSGKYL